MSEDQSGFARRAFLKGAGAAIVAGQRLWAHPLSSGAAGKSSTAAVSFDSRSLLVHGKVLRTAQFGAFVEIAEGVEGLCHISEAGDEGGGPSKLETGLEHEFKIIKINVEEKKVGLSLRAVNGQEASRAQVESYKTEGHKHPVSSSTTTLGDLINWKSER